MKGLIGFVFDMAILIGLGAVSFNHIYHETKVMALEQVGQGTVSLTKLTESMTGRKSWLKTSASKNVLQDVGRWN